jgi:hypothetical protein
MKWPWTQSRPSLEGAQARERAEKSLEQAINDRLATEAETPSYRALGNALRQLREENHFAHAIRESMRPR